MQEGRQKMEERSRAAPSGVECMSEVRMSREEGSNQWEGQNIPPWSSLSSSTLIFGHVT